MSKVDAYGKALGLLNKIQSRVEIVSDRLNVVGRESGETADRLAALQGASAIAAKNQTDALYAFRESVQSAFKRVENDRDALTATVQKLVERVSQVESQNLALVTENRARRAEVDTLRAEIDTIVADAKNLSDLKAALRLFVKG